ncbi:DUF3616 domain-containing protein [Leptolyngbya sp. NK1-12]|uniref:DUF3616 domain-containing protein n=1 Tax=Leptolyngbya sp. NK1-12 TaxID=2547451 RepID=A0AA96WD58_9CYAN|nr:DUF3616 domain-containing protein [Leptolyngbya sp. NK1-12]WNZ22370.1 DUF3616 domain-containing protein [Leptolyngbya sp. NK1-12]
MAESFLLSRVLLRFRSGSRSLLSNLSAVALDSDGNLWVGSDELSQIDDQELNTLDRLSVLKCCEYGNHEPFPLHEILKIDDSLGEIDIEGLDYADSYLWLTGSHSTKRKKPKGKSLEKDIQRLTKVQPDPNRYLIARIPVVEGQLHQSCPDPKQPDRQLTAACLKQKKQGNHLMKALHHDDHLADYVANRLPGKENGFDVEGIAVRQNRLFLGLRGPVLRGWAILLELELEDADVDTLALKPLESSEQRYRKHFLQLDGLGIRDICFYGDDLLILAGPTMDLTGTQRLYCWRDALHRLNETVCELESNSLECVFELPYSSSGDKAEGIALFPCLGEANALLVLYDSPNSSRRVDQDSVYGDVFRLPF